MPIKRRLHSSDTYATQTESQTLWRQPAAGGAGAAAM